MARNLLIETTLKGTKKVEGQLAGVEKKGKGLGGTLTKSLGAAALKLAPIVAGFVAIAGAIKLARSAFSAFIAEEEAINDLNVALQATNTYTEEVSQSIQDWASEIQSVTTLGNELLLSVVAQGQAIAQVAKDDIPKLGQAALQISKLYKLDMNAAVLLVSKSLTSSTNALARYGVEFDTSGTKAEKLNAILAATSQGMIIAQGETMTLTGAQQQLGNTWGDFLEIITGASGITMPALVEAMRAVIVILDIFGAAIKKNTESAGEDTENMGSLFAVVFGGIARTIIVATGIIGSLINGLKMIFNGLGLVVIEVAQVIVEQIDKTTKIMGFTIPAIESTMKSLQDTQDKWLINLAANISDQEALTDTLAEAWGAVSIAEDKMKLANDGLGVSLDTLLGKIEDGTGAIDANTAAKDRNTAATERAAAANFALTSVAGFERAQGMGFRKAGEPGPAPPTEALSLFPSGQFPRDTFLGKLFAGLKGRPAPEGRGTGNFLESLQSAMGTAGKAKERVEAREKAAVSEGEKIGASISKGITSHNWKGLGRIISSEIQSALDVGKRVGGGILGGVAGGLFGGFVEAGIGKLFGKGKSRPAGTASDPIHSMIINPQDIATAFLTMTQAAQARVAGAGLNQLQQQRLAQASVNLKV